MAYDPVKNHFLFTVQKGQDGVDTWMLKGRTWSLVNSDSTWYEMLDASMFFDPTLQAMVDFRTRPLYPTPTTHILIWNYDSNEWELHDELPQSSQVVALDTERKVYVIPGKGYSGNYQTWEYDLTSLVSHPNSRVPDNYAFSYDPSIQRCILPRALDIWEWDGTQWMELDHPIPTIYDFQRSVYSPYHDGIIFTTVLNVVLFKNYAWSYLIEYAHSSTYLLSAILVYNSQEEKVYAFINLGYMATFRLVNYKHDRPFNKP